MAQWVREDIEAGKALSSAPLPAWVFEGPVAQNGGVHTAEGSWSAAQGRYVAPARLPVHERQRFPESLAGLGADALKSGTEEFRNEELRAWSPDGEVLVASITAKLHLISPAVTQGLLQALEIAEQKYQGLVIWSPDDVFSAGANLESLMPVFMKMGSKGIAPEVKKLQDLMLRMRYAAVPVVAAVRGLALGGGCELALYASKRGRGDGVVRRLRRGGRGAACRRAAASPTSRAARPRTRRRAPGADLLAFLKEGFTAAATAKVGTSALDSRAIGYLLDSDVVVPNKDELLHVAIAQAKAMSASGWRAPLKRLFPVAGRSAIATIQAQLVEHARRRLHQRARLPHRQPDRRRGLRRRRWRPARWSARST